MVYVVLFCRHNLPYITTWLGLAWFGNLNLVFYVRRFFVEILDEQGHILQIEIPWNHPFPVM